MSIAEAKSEQLGGFQPGEEVSIRVDGVATIGKGLLPGNFDAIPDAVLEQAFTVQEQQASFDYARLTGIAVVAGSSGPKLVSQIALDSRSQALFGECEVGGARILTDAEKVSHNRWLKVDARVEAFTPGSKVYLIAESDRIVIGEAVVSADGTVALSGTVPVDALGAGAHRFRIVGSRVLEKVFADSQGNISLSDSAMAAVRTMDNQSTAIVHIDAPDMKLVRYIPLRENAPWWMLVLIVLLAAFAMRERREAHLDPSAVRRAARMRLAQALWVAPLAMGLFVAAFGFASLYFELITPAIVIGCIGLYMARTSPLIRAGADVPARRATRSLPTA
jgi:hypothetical protein